MRDYVNGVLAPLWRQFVGVHKVRVMLGVEQDPHGFSFPLVLAITYSGAKHFLAATAVTSDSLIRHPCASWQLATLPKHVNWHTATRVPITADTKPSRGQQINKLFTNANCTGFVE